MLIDLLIHWRSAMLRTRNIYSFATPSQLLTLRAASIARAMAAHSLSLSLSFAGRAPALVVLALRNAKEFRKSCERVAGTSIKYTYIYLYDYKYTYIYIYLFIYIYLYIYILCIYKYISISLYIY